MSGGHKVPNTREGGRSFGRPVVEVYRETTIRRRRKKVLVSLLLYSEKKKSLVTVKLFRSLNYWTLYSPTGSRSVFGFWKEY